MDTTSPDTPGNLTSDVASLWNTDWTTVTSSGAILTGARSLLRNNTDVNNEQLGNVGIDDFSLFGLETMDNFDDKGSTSAV